MTTKTVRRVYVSFAVAAALTSVAACGGSDTPKASEKPAKDSSRAVGGVVNADAIAALRQVQQKTGGARSAKIDGTMEVGSTMSMKQSGTIDWTDGITGALKITYTGGTMGDALKKSGSDGTMRTRYFKDAYYADMGDAFAANMGGKHWIRYAYTDLAQMAGASGEVMKDQMQNSTPEQGVKALLASGDVKKAGQEDVRGVATTHYSGTVDVAELTEKTSALDAGQLAAFKKQLGELGITTQKVDIWVDENDLLVKKAERGETKNGAVNSTVFYSDYGTEVSVEEPPPADTVEFKEIMEQQGSTAGVS